MKKLALLLLICFSFLAASAQTTPVSPKGPVQASPYHEASTNRMWLFNPTFGWFVIPDSTYIKKFIGADTLRFKAGQFKNIGTSTAVKIALQTDTQKTTPIYYLGIDPTTKNLRYDTTQFGTASGGYLPLTLTHDTTVSVGAYSLQFLSANASDLAISSNEIFSTVQSGTNASGFDVQSGFSNLTSQGTADISTFLADNTGSGAQITYQKNGTPLTFKRFILNDDGTGISVEDGIDHIGLNGVQVFPLSGSPSQYAQYGKVDSLITAHSSGVSSFNSRVGAVTLLSSDVTTALGFTPENIANKATSFSIINNTLYPSVQAVNTKLGNYVPLIGGVTITGEVQDSYTPLIANDLARLTDLGLVPTVLTGMGVTVVGTTASIGSGTYRLNNITYTYTGGTITIPAQDATQYRYSILYITTPGTISIINGALVPSDPVIPDFPDNSVEVSIIYIPPTGGTVTPTGGGNKGTGTLTNFSFINTNGFIGSVANPTTKPALTLTLKTILPSVVAQTGLGTAGTDSLMVKHSGTMKAIAPGYYLAATTASTTYVPLTRTVNGKALSSNITLGLASSDFANQGATTTLLHGNAAGNPSFSQVVNADIASATIDLTTKVTGLLPVANGGTGTSTPGIVAGTNITVTGTWPNQTVNATSSGGLTSSNFVVNEVPSGTINGSNVTFTLANTPTTGKVTLYKNGVELVSTADYTISGSTITYVVAPNTVPYTDTLTASYLK